LLPQDQNLNRLFRYITLESGLAAGFALIVLGLGASFLAVGSWGAAHFGLLDPAHSLRLVIPAVLSLTLGFEVVFSSFFLSVLGMKRKDRVVPGVESQADFPTAVREASERAPSQSELARAVTR
jgi:hypothetical protein